MIGLTNWHFLQTHANLNHSMELLKHESTYHILEPFPYHFKLSIQVMVVMMLIFILRSLQISM
jgi:hypothetical protein